MKESDNNVKLIVLDRLIALKEHPAQERVLQDLVMDILRVLASPDLEVRKKTLNLGNNIQIMLDESNYSVVLIGPIPFDLQDGYEGQRGKGYNNHALFGLPKRVIE